jgi:cytochrome o ubiquinol oxidase subunit III
MASNVLDNNVPLTEDPHLIKIASTKVYGFWIYLMSDCVLFATLFTTYAILSSSAANIPSPNNLFNLHNVLLETFCLLTSTFTYGLSMYAMEKENKLLLIAWLIVTLLLGLSFLGLEIDEFHFLIMSGNGPEQSSYWSAFFSLVATHGTHVFFGLIWIGIMIAQVINKGLTLTVKTRMILLSLFWHFLDIVWICIFTFVYLMRSL